MKSRLSLEERFLFCCWKEQARLDIEEDRIGEKIEEEIKPVSDTVA
jgi:hypothetical protein